MCRGGSPPAPPPDYSAEKAQFAADTLAQYQSEADAYNAQVDAFNQNITDYQNQLSAGQSAYDSATIYDLYDDPDTAANEDVLAGYRSDLQGFDPDNLDSDFGEAPIFNPVVQSPYGPVTITDIPTLSTANTSLADSLYGQGQTLLGDIEDLYGQRQTAFDAFNTRAGTLADSYTGLENRIGDSNIASNLAGLRTDLQQTAASAAGISDDPFYAQSEYADIDPSVKLNMLQNRINDLYNARAAEYDRISNYESSLNTSANAFAGETAGLTITDMDRINEIENEIRQLERQAGQFNSLLGFDFSQELGGFGDARGDIRQLREDRAAEEQRIADYRDETLEGVRGLRDAAFTTNMYDLGALDALDARLGDFQTDAGSFSSVLPFEVPGLQGYYDTINERTGGLRQRRSDALDAIEGRIGDVTGGLDSIALYNTGAFTDAQRRLDDIGFDLDQFSGGRVAGIAEQIAAGGESVDAKFRELQAYRAALEEEMIELLADIRTRDYYNFGDVASGRDDVYNREKEVRLYNAQNAMDEIDDMLEALKGQDRRLKADEEARAARQADAASSVSFGNMAMNRGGFTPMTASQYQRFISTQQDEPQFNYNPSAFSNALGVIRV